MAYRRQLPRILIAFGATVAALLSAARAPDVGAETAGSSRLVHVRILGINDLHGHLEPSTVGGRTLGGVAWLASWLDQRAAGVQTIRVTAGDSPGASPLISAHFHDRPTVEALDLMRFDVATLGNHDLDEGAEEMLRLTHSAHFPHISANVIRAETGRPLLPPYAIVERGGVRVGFIGVTTRASGRWLLPEHAKRLRFADISETVNRYADELEREGVRAVVVLAHAGGSQSDADDGAGEIFDETREMSDAVDVVVSGHTHTRINLHVGHKLLVQAVSYGTAFDQVDMTIERATGEVVETNGDVVDTEHDDAEPDPKLTALVDSYRARLGDLATNAIAYLRAPLTRVPDDAGGSPVGRLVAESERDAADAEVAFVPPDWVRADLPAGAVTYADLFDVQPFGNDVIRMTMSGADLEAVLAQQDAPGQPELISVGLPPRIARDRTYTVAASQFLAEGGEGFTAFARATDRKRVGRDVDVLAEYVARRFQLG